MFPVNEDVECLLLCKKMQLNSNWTRDKTNCSELGHFSQFLNWQFAWTTKCLGKRDTRPGLEKFKIE